MEHKGHCESRECLMIQWCDKITLRSVNRKRFETHRAGPPLREQTGVHPKRTKTPKRVQVGAHTQPIPQQPRCLFLLIWPWAKSQIASIVRAERVVQVTFLQSVLKESCKWRLTAHPRLTSVNLKSHWRYLIIGCAPKRLWIWFGAGDI